MGDAVESYWRGILLFYWKFKKLQPDDVHILYFSPLWCFEQEWSVAPWKFNIKERGVGSLHSLGETELRWSKQVVFSWQFGTFWWTFSHNICFWKFREKLQSLTKRKIILNTSNTHLVMKAVSVYMSIDEIMVVILFLFSH